MAEVTIRDLRNHGGDVIERVLAGEQLTVTRDGKPVAELRPLRRSPLSASALLERWSRLAPIDPEALRADIDELLDTSL
jgi:prevent-host-death family protein